MRRIISVISLVTASIFAMLFVSPTVYAADSSCDSYVFAIPAWYNGLMGRSSGSCQFEAEKMGGADKDKPDVVRTAGKIGSNVVQALMVIAAYVAVFFLIKDALRNILNTAYFWATVIAVIAIIIAGFFYTTSMNNPNQVARAKNAILYAIVGLVVVIMAFAITNFVMEAV